MTYYNYSVNIVDFVSDLATKAIAEGWHREEVGYDTIYPDGYSGFKVLFESLYASIINGSSGSSSYYFTYITVHCRATYNAGTHVPTTNANGGDARFRMIYNADHHASATKKYYVKGWIDSKHICIDVLADPTIADNARWLIYVGEVEAVDAAANTCMCLTPEVLNQVCSLPYRDELRTRPRRQLRLLPVHLRPRSQLRLEQGQSRSPPHLETGGRCRENLSALLPDSARHHPIHDEGRYRG
jgi:hypothetical protein